MALPPQKKRGSSNYLMKSTNLNRKSSISIFLPLAIIIVIAVAYKFIKDRLDMRQQVIDAKRREHYLKRK